MTPPGVIIELRLESPPQVRLEYAGYADVQRLCDWLRAHPDWFALASAALSLAEGDEENATGTPHSLVRRASRRLEFVKLAVALGDGDYTRRLLGAVARDFAVAIALAETDDGMGRAA